MVVPVVVVGFRRVGLLRLVLGGLFGGSVVPSVVVGVVDGCDGGVVGVFGEFGCRVVVRGGVVGCGFNVMLGVRDVVREFGCCVVLEDDVVPGFCWYESMCLLLGRYGGEVGGVGGFPCVVGGGWGDVCFSARFCGWGWGVVRERFEVLWGDWVVFRGGGLPWGLELVGDVAGGDIVDMLRGCDRGHGWDVCVAGGFLVRGWLQAVCGFALVRNVGGVGVSGDFLRGVPVVDRVPVVFPEVGFDVGFGAAVREFVLLMLSGRGRLFFPCFLSFLVFYG